MRVLRVPIHKVPFTLAAYMPIDCGILDVMTFNVTHENGNESVKVTIDAFTKWVKPFPTESFS